MTEAKPEWQIQMEKTDRARNIIREIEDRHPSREYLEEREGNLGEGETSRIRFPSDLDINKLVEISNPRRIKKGLELIDEKYPWKLCSYGSGSNFGGENYHLFVHNAPKIIEILDILKERAQKRTGRYDGDQEQVKSITNQEITSFEEIYPYIRGAALAGARPTGFISALSGTLKTVRSASDPNYLEERLAEAEEKYDKRVQEVGDSWNRHEYIADEDVRKQAIERAGEKLKERKTNAEKHAAYNQSLRDSGRLEGLDLDHIAKSIISLYRYYDDSGVNEVFGVGWTAKNVKNTEFGLEAPLYLEIPFDELVGKMKKGAKLGISPGTYADLMCAFMNDQRTFQFEDRGAFEKDLFKFFREVSGVTENPNGYVSKSLLANRRENRSLPETMGYEAAKEFALVSASHGIDPKNIETLAAQYRGGYW